MDVQHDLMQRLFDEYVQHLIDEEIARRRDGLAAENASRAAAGRDQLRSPDWGRVITKDDVLGYNEGNVSDFVEDFVAFARKRLAENQVISMEYTDQGLCLRLQDSSVVPLTTAGEGARTTGGNAGSMAVVRPDKPKAEKGIDKQNSMSWGVTGADT